MLFIKKETCHPFEQKPIKDNFEVKVISNSKQTTPSVPIVIKNDDKYKADVVESSNSNKENIPPYSNKVGYKYLPTMIDFRDDFDKKYKLPTVRKQRLTSKQKIDQRNKKKEELSIKLAEVEEKMKLIKKK